MASTPLPPQKHVLLTLLLFLLPNLFPTHLCIETANPSSLQRHLLQTTTPSTTPTTTTPSTTPTTTTPSTTPSTTPDSPAILLNAPPPPDRPNFECNGIFLSYKLDNMTKIRPFVTNSTGTDAPTQPYGFGGTASLQNAYTITLRNYTLIMGFKHKEIIVSLAGGVLTNDYPLPYNTSQSPLSMVSFSGYPNGDLPTPIATGGNLKKIVANITMVGTMFGKQDPLPKNLTLGDPSWLCGTPDRYGSYPNFTSVCCVPNPRHLPEPEVITTNVTYDRLIDPSDYQPRNTGNITISYDVMLTYDNSYLAEVTLENKDLLTRLDGWQVSWEWKRNEFLYQIKGAYTSQTGISECLFGPQGKYYAGMDFTNVTNCQRKPVILDLPPWRYNDSEVGRIPFCCRNGTIFPKMVNATAYKSAFQILVFKLPPDLDRYRLYSPENFTLSSISPLSHKYKCSEPIRVNPHAFPDPSGLSLNSTAVASWQVTCNITSNLARKCCVSFSSYYNKSVMPCGTCACGCPTRSAGPPCSTSAPPVLIPQESLLQRYDNRTLKQLQWADKNHFTLPKTLPCGDYCGINLNWHVLNQTKNKGSFDARLTIMNWDNSSYVKWYVAVKMNPLYAAYTDSDGYNVTAVNNDTLILIGNVNSSYLLQVSNTSHPGMHQGVLMFDQLMGMNVKNGDGNPVKVYFNGEECAMPDDILSDTPSNLGYKKDTRDVFGLVFGLFMLCFFIIG